MTKYCVDCHFARNKVADEEQWQCYSPQNIYADKRVSLLTGVFVRYNPACSFARRDSDSCTPDALFHMTTKEYLASIPALSDKVNTVAQKTNRKIGVEDL